MIFEVFTAVSMKTAFWIMTLSSLAGGNQRFRGSYYFCLQSNRGSPGTILITYKTRVQKIAIQILISMCYSHCNGSPYIKHKPKYLIHNIPKFNLYLKLTGII
jgi:hypothetical protein